MALLESLPNSTPEKTRLLKAGKDSGMELGSEKGPPARGV
jgi:hypothetical protein